MGTPDPEKYREEIIKFVEYILKATDTIREDLKRELKVHLQRRASKINPALLEQAKETLKELNYSSNKGATINPNWSAYSEKLKSIEDILKSQEYHLCKKL